MTRYRIELRTYNIGADGKGSGAGLGYALNFLVLVEVRADGSARPVREYHGHSFDRKTGEPNHFDATGGSQLKALEDKRGLITNFYRDSFRHPSFVLFEGSQQEAMARWEKAGATDKWIAAQDFTYWPLGTNSNSVVRTLARAMGFDIKGQPIDRATGRHIEAPGGDIDLTKGRSDAPKPFTEKPVRVFGYGDDGTPRERPIPPEREAPPYDGPELPRRGAAPAQTAPASYRLGFENARRFAEEHRFDPNAEPKLSPQQNRIVSAWVERVLAPAVAHAQLPKGLAGDVLDHAAATTAHEAGLVLQRGLNRLAGPADFATTPPAFADGTARRVAEDGWVGPETLAATAKHATVHGLGRVREAVALSAFERGLDRLATGEAGADEAPSVFRRSVGRLFRNPDGEPAGRFAPPRPSSAPAVQPRHEEVATLQESINDANRIFGFADEPLDVDGDLGPKTSAALVSAARAAGPERLADHLAKRLGIGEPDLMDDPARGFDTALDDGDEHRGQDGYGAFG